MVKVLVKANALTAAPSAPRAVKIGRKGTVTMSRLKPRAEQIAGEQVRDHRAVRGDGFERHRRGPGRQGRSHDHEAHRLIEDHRLEGGEANAPSRSGKRNSAPPRSTSPLKVPMRMPPPNAAAPASPSLKRDVADPAIAEAIARNQALAAALGITGTPGFVAVDRVAPGALDRPALEELIAEARRKSETAP